MREIKKKILLFLPLGIIVVGLMLFLPAGSLNYWQAWLFMAILFIPFLFVVAYLLKHDPELLERRLRTKEKEAGEVNETSGEKIYENPELFGLCVD